MKTCKQLFNARALPDDPLQFWAKRPGVLARTARAVLNVPAVVTSVDSFFSIMGNDIGPQRSTCKRALDQCMLRANGDYKGEQKCGWMHQFFCDTRTVSQREEAMGVFREVVATAAATPVGSDFSTPAAARPAARAATGGGDDGEWERMCE